MNVAVLSESSADEAACQILTAAVHAGPITWIEKPRLRARGWPAVVNVLPAVLKHLHYQTLADGLVVIVDGNHSPVHTAPHVQKPDGDCRACKLLAVAHDTLAGLTPILNRGPLQLGIGLAAPAIEAWYLVGRQAGVSEAAWIQGRAQKQEPYTTRQLKAWAYGTEIPSLAQETQQAVTDATRLSGDLDGLEAAFPGSFGLFRRQVQSW